MDVENGLQLIKISKLDAGNFFIYENECYEVVEVFSSGNMCSVEAKNFLSGRLRSIRVSRNREVTFASIYDAVDMDGAIHHKVPVVNISKEVFDKYKDFGEIGGIYKEYVRTPGLYYLKGSRYPDDCALWEKAAAAFVIGASLMGKDLKILDKLTNVSYTYVTRSGASYDTVVLFKEITRCRFIDLLHTGRAPEMPYVSDGGYVNLFYSVYGVQHIVSLVSKDKTYGVYRYELNNRLVTASVCRDTDFVADYRRWSRDSGKVGINEYMQEVGL